MKGKQDGIMERAKDRVNMPSIISYGSDSELVIYPVGASISSSRNSSVELELRSIKFHDSMYQNKYF